MSSFKDSIIQILISDQLISQENLDKAMMVQKEKGGRLSDILVELKFIEEDKLLMALSKVFSKPSIDISRFKVDPIVLKMIPLNICKHYQIIPISKIGDTLTLAMADPLNILALDEVKSLTGYKINPIIAESKRIMQAIEHYYGEASSAVIENLIQGISQEKIELIRLEKEEVPSTDELGRLTQEAPIIGFVNRLFEQAVNLKASDVLVEPYGDKLRVRFRIDGMLKEQANAPKTMLPLIVSRIKVVSGLDIAEHRLPQDGRFRMKFASGSEVDFRVSVLPSSIGEKAAVRVLDRTRIELDIGKLGFQEVALVALKKCAAQPHGMILACGPTGSGKTTTLYSLIKLVDSPKINIITVEDPVEFQMHGINQVTVQPDVGLTFASALRSILRQDPNVIMVGEIRDFDTIDIAIKSALTGHLVLSTLHTTTASGAVVRMINMGVEPFLISSSVICIVAQRLVRILCVNCKEKYEVKEDLASKLKLPKDNNASNIFYRPKGCQRCYNTGYKGRVVLSEVLTISPKIRDLILNRAEEHVIKQAARAEGMQTLREDGIQKVRAAITSLEEVLRVTAPDE